jgi:hypothetical protein
LVERVFPYGVFLCLLDPTLVEEVVSYDVCPCLPDPTPVEEVVPYDVYPFYPFFGKKNMFTPVYLIPH